MRVLVWLMLSAFLVARDVADVHAQTTDDASVAAISVVIKEVVPDGKIRGSVAGIPSGKHDEYKILVYVETDKWYVHPYKQGGEGLSYAKIRPDGSWEIQTVQRDFLAERVAALVVRQDQAGVSPVDDLRRLNPIAKYIEKGDGRL